MAGNKILDEPEIQELIEFRKIRPADYSIITNLANFSKIQLMSNFHNFFLQYRDNSATALESQLQDLDDKINSGKASEAERRLREMTDWFLEICRNYDWATANNLVRVLERTDLNK